MHDFLTLRVRATPERTALVDPQADVSWSYAELDEAVDDLASRFAALGIEPGDRLGLLAPTSMAAIQAVHATFRSGARLVPLNVRLTSAELERRIEQTSLEYVVCTAETAEMVPDRSDLQVVSLDGGSVPSLYELPPGDTPPQLFTLTDPVVIIFTSGTTGDPKAVPLTVGNVLASAAASAFRLGVLPTDRWLLVLPIYHMGGLAPVLRSTIYGTAIVVQEGFEPERMTHVIDAYEVTGVSLVPTQLRRCIDTDVDLAGSLRFVLLGGAPAKQDLIDACREQDIPVYPTYGTTETASQVATATPTEAFEYNGTVGQPLLGTTVTIVDDGGETVSSGEVGEVVVSGPTVTPGYLDGDDDAFGPSGFQTGDLGYRDEGGRLWIVGRTDDRILTGGENVAPIEVENVLREHPAVTDVAVVGMPDREWGERVGALLVRDTPVTTEELQEYCRERLAEFKRPRTLAFTDDLPRTSSGTVDRNEVRDQLDAA